MHLVVETDAALALELPDLTSDLAPDKRLPDLEEAKLPLDLLFEYPKRRQRHGNHT
jgi:hypothetical protein